jgi:hypothetical protein
MEKLFSERALGSRRDSEKTGRLMTGHHGARLEGVLKNEILFTGEKSGGFEHSKSDG